MDASKSHFRGLIWASIAIVVFAAVAILMIVIWSPLLPEATAVDMSRDDANATYDFLPYIALHQTESWRYTVALNDLVAIAYCSR
ncbi:hypothetical protein HEAR1244 [Herminiimonas arsenicoxydans]|uniref:Uncharacterized protein n=1 Tax=Herminiimonas arsenicoxydans TaxID=204773 RepID=A4G4I2_HERAR|nr:hypothetical protein HEAR1244 [Herminiimonas arsenicoxydans]